MTRAREPVAPRFLDPVLAVVERIDRAVRRIQPVAPGSLLGLEPHRYRGQPVMLADGTRVEPGDPVCTLHLDNARVRALAGPDWQTEGFRVGRADFRLVAAWHRALPPGERPVAYTGITLLGALVRREGWEVRDRRPSPWVRLQDWYLRSLLVRWAPGGRERLARGRHPLRTQRIWLSGAEFLSRYSQ